MPPLKFAAENVPRDGPGTSGGRRAFFSAQR